MSVAVGDRSTAVPVAVGRPVAFTGTWPLARAALRRDRVRTPAWGVGLAAMVLAVAPTFDRLFPQTREMRSKRVDARGWHAGRAAADRAVFAAAQVEGG